MTSRALTHAATPRTLTGVLLAALLLVPAAGAQSRYAVGPGPDPINPGKVKVYDGLSQSEISAFSTTYGTHVAFSDMTGDDRAEVIAGAGPAQPNPPQVRGFQTTGAPIAGINFLAYGSGSWGVQVAGNELPFTAFEELITLPGYGAPFSPMVRGWAYDGSSVGPLSKVNYYLSSMFATQATLGHGDFNADGYEEILTSERTSLGTWVTATNLAGSGGNIFRTLLGGQLVHAAGGNVDNSPADELIVGSQTSTGPRVRGFDVAGGLVPIARLNFVPFSCTQCSARPAVGNLDEDAYDEILVGSTAGSTTVRAFNYDNTLLTSTFQKTPYGGAAGARAAISDSLY